MDSKRLTLAAWVPTAACTGGRGDGPETEDQSRSAGSVPARSQSFSRGTVPIKIVGSVAGQGYRAGGTGECASSVDASIYDVPATLWHAMYEDDGSCARFDEVVAEGG